MEYKDIKTADELESWYADKQAVLDRHARDYMVPFGYQVRFTPWTFRCKGCKSEAGRPRE